jgi:hypothetical protein
VKKDRPSKLFILTTVVKLVFLALLFIGVPYIVITLFNRYQEKASGIVDQQAVVVDTYSDTSSSVQSLSVLTQEEVTALNNIRDALQGNWSSQQDGRYILSIDPNGKFAEYYDSVKEGYGVWKVVPQDVGTTSPDQIYIFQKEQFEPGHNGEIYSYKIQQLDDLKFIILYNGGDGTPLVFTKTQNQ